MWLLFSIQFGQPYYLEIPNQKNVYPFQQKELWGWLNNSTTVYHWQDRSKSHWFRNAKTPPTVVSRQSTEWCHTGVQQELRKFFKILLSQMPRRMFNACIRCNCYEGMSFFLSAESQKKFSGTSVPQRILWTRLIKLLQFEFTYQFTFVIKTLKSFPSTLSLFSIHAPRHSAAKFSSPEKTILPTTVFLLLANLPITGACVWHLSTRTERIHKWHFPINGHCTVYKCLPHAVC